MTPWLLLTLGAWVASSPMLESGDGGDVAVLDLKSWHLHSGALPDLYKESGQGLLDPAAFAETWQQAQGAPWPEALLPVTLEGEVQRAQDANAESTWWLMSSFLANPRLQGRSVMLSLSVSEALLDVYLNGNLIGATGSHHPGTLEMRSPWPNAYFIAPSLLYLDRPNVLALRIYNPILDVQVSEISLLDSQMAAGHVFFFYTLPFMFNVGIGFVLLAIALFCLFWYLRHLQEHEDIYVVAGTLGYLLTFTLSWLPYVPGSGVLAVSLGSTGLMLTNFLALFFQKRYKIHEHRAWAWILGCATAVVLLLSLLLGNVLSDMRLLLLIAPVSLAGFVYAIYLNVRAMQAGNKEPRTVLWGYVLFVLGSGTDLLLLILEHRGFHTFSGIGFAGLGVTILLSLMSRFSHLHATSHDFVERLRRKQDLQDFLITQISEAASAIEVASGHILTSASQQQLGATEQSTAVEETRRTMESLLMSGRGITTASQDVLQNAEMTQQHNHTVAERIAESSNHSRRISEILDIIRDIANKSELLALNAALEGSRAGDAGRGFALVATQMQRLAENVMNAVADIKDLTADIRAATTATEQSTLQAGHLASETTESAHKIGLIIHEQQAGTEQVTRAMDDVAKIAQQTAVSGQTTLERTYELMQKATSLRALVEQYRSGANG